MQLEVAEVSVSERETFGGSSEEKGSGKLPEARLCPSAGLRDLGRFFSV